MCLSVIHGYDVLLDEDSKNSNYIFNKNLAFTSSNEVEIQFSRRLASDSAYPHSVDLSDCLTNTDGISMFLLTGSLATDGSILFNSTSTPKSIGPFCFNSCSSKRANKYNQQLTESQTTNVDLQILSNQFDNDARKFFQNETTTEMVGVTTQEMATEAVTTEFITPRANPSTDPFTTAEMLAAETTTEDTTTAESTTTTPVPTTTTTTTTTSTTTTTATTTTTTTSTTSPVPKLDCPAQTYLNTTQFNMYQFYDKTADSVNLTLSILAPKVPSQYAIYAVNSTNSEEFIIYGEINSTGFFQKFANTPGLTLWPGLNSNNINSLTFSLPRSYQFALIDENVRDCSVYRVYYSDKDASGSLEANAAQFQNDVTMMSVNFTNTNQVCLDTCCSARKSYVLYSYHLFCI